MSLECTSKSLCQVISGDLSHAHTLLEEEYQQTNTRELPWHDCKKLVRYVMHSKFLYAFKIEQNLIIRIDVSNNAFTTFTVPNLSENFNVGDHEYSPLVYVVLNNTDLFIIGDAASDAASCNCFQLDLVTKKLTRKANMNIARKFHCAYCVNEIVYVFGGYCGTAETYGIKTDQWRDMPTPTFTENGGLYCQVDYWNGNFFVTGFFELVIS